VIESKTVRNGTARRRRYKCQGCNKRWTLFFDRKGNLLSSPPEHAERHKAKRRPRQRILSEEQIRFILSNSEIPFQLLATRIGANRETVRQVCRGIIYSDVCTELPRKPMARRSVIVVPGEGVPSCELCTSWTEGRCKERFPDPEIEGPGFAADCDFYEKRPEVA